MAVCCKIIPKIIKIDKYLHKYLTNICGRVFVDQCTLCMMIMASIFLSGLGWVGLGWITENGPTSMSEWRFENKIAIFDQLMATTQCSLRSVSCAALNQVPRSRVWFCYAPADEGQTSVYVYLTWRPYLIPLTMIYRCSTTQSAMERQFVLRGSAMQLFSWYLFFELYVGLYCSDTSSTVFIELFSCLRKQSLYVLGWQGRLDTLELTSPKFLTWFNDEDITDAFPRL